MAHLMQELTGWFGDVFFSNWDSWAILGLIGQLCFTMRFVVQWLASELAKKSVVPFAFWVFSLLGGGLLLLYSIYLRNPVFILGNGIGFCVYLRNIFLIRRERRQQKTTPAADKLKQEEEPRII